MLLQEQRYGSVPVTNQHRERLEGKDLKRVAKFIGAAVGIQLPDSKHTLVEGRLRKRLHVLGFSTFKDYLDHALESDSGERERLHLIDAITTNKTEFFREPDHFDYLHYQALPVLQGKMLEENRRCLHIWSAGCSTGEEPYTLSMVMNEAAEKIPELKFDILATDISQKCLVTAKRGIYTEKNISPVSLELRKKYILKSRKPGEDIVCMGPELKRYVQFQALNLVSDSFSIEQKMDVIFCRNVMIYFDKAIREKLVNRFEKQLVSGGYLFVGHSESLSGINTGLVQVAPMVYRKVIGK